MLQAGTSSSARAIGAEAPHVDFARSILLPTAAAWMCSLTTAVVVWRQPMSFYGVVLVTVSLYYAFGALSRAV